MKQKRFIIQKKWSGWLVVDTVLDKTVSPFCATKKLAKEYKKRAERELKWILKTL